MEGKVRGHAACGAPAQPSAARRVLAQTLQATRSSCHASSFSAPQPYPSPWGVPSRVPASPAPGGRARGAGGSRGVYLACGGRAVGAAVPARELERELGWGDGPGRRGRRSRPAPDDTAARPRPDPPARASAPCAPNSRNSSLERPRFQFSQPHSPCPRVCSGLWSVPLSPHPGFSSFSLPRDSSICLPLFLITQRLSPHLNPRGPT